MRCRAGRSVGRARLSRLSPPVLTANAFTRPAHIPKTEVDCESELIRLLEERRRVRGDALRCIQAQIAGVARLRDFVRERELRAFQEISATSERRARASAARFETNFAEAW